MLRIVERTGNPMLEIPLPGLFACPGIRARSLRDRPRRFAFRTSDIEPATPLDVAGWNRSHGCPSEATLSRLGLGFVRLGLCFVLVLV